MRALLRFGCSETAQSATYIAWTLKPNSISGKRLGNNENHQLLAEKLAPFLSSGYIKRSCVKREVICEHYLTG
ncbi:hypothetical protein IFVP22_C1280024 [Vibrio parahaemolyticus]